MRKVTRNRKDTRCTKCAYFNSCYFILLLIKSRRELFHFQQLVYFIYKYKTKDKNNTYIKKKDLYKIVILVEKNY